MLLSAKVVFLRDIEGSLKNERKVSEGCTLQKLRESVTSFKNKVNIYTSIDRDIFFLVYSASLVSKIHQLLQNYQSLYVNFYINFPSYFSIIYGCPAKKNKDDEVVN